MVVLYIFSGCLVKHWSHLLATSRAQQQLFRIVDVLLLSHALLQQDSGAHTQMLSALKESLPLFLQVNTPPNPIHTLYSYSNETFPYILRSLLMKFPVFAITKIVLVSSGFVSSGECVPVSGSVPKAAAAQGHFPVPEPLSPIHTLYWSGGQSSCPAGSLRINTHPAGGKTQEEHSACAEV